MNIELKNIKHSPSLSEETNAFTANLYIDGKKAAYVKNDGQGGSTSYLAESKEVWDLIRRAENYCKSLPDKHYPKDEYSEGFSIKMNLENYIDDLLEAHLHKKELEKVEKKVLKDMEKGIVFGKPNDFSWIVQTFNVPLPNVLKHPRGAEIISNSITKSIIGELKDGVKILNTNIPESILKIAGLSNEQYIKPAVTDIQKTIDPAEERADSTKNRTR
jgi:hypothetical protein